MVQKCGLSSGVPTGDSQMQLFPRFPACLRTDGWSVGNCLLEFGENLFTEVGGGCSNCFWTGRLQMHKTWQPLLPLKRKAFAMFGDISLSLGVKQNKTLNLPISTTYNPSSSGRLPALNFIYHLRPYVEILITDIFIFISQTEKACLSSKASY